MMDIQAEITALQKQTGLSQAAIARLLGLTGKTFNAWLTGRVQCRHRRLLLLALQALRMKL